MGSGGVTREGKRATSMRAPRMEVRAVAGPEGRKWGSQGPNFVDGCLVEGRGRILFLGL